jgi:hypothetical protein
MRLLAILALLLAGEVHAADMPLVRVELSPESVNVGESIRLRVTVLGPSWFPSPPRYPSFEITNAVVRRPANSSFPFSERINGDTWSGIVRDYEVIPLIGGNFELDDLVMQVTYAEPGTIEPVVVNVAVPPIRFRAVVPAGAENLQPYIAGTAFELRRELDRDTTNLKVGDALVVTYTAELTGLPSMFIPEYLSRPDMPGVSVYAGESKFSDDATASRLETLTFVFEAGGEFEIPGVALDWWNTQTASVETAKLPAVMVSVVGPPVTTASTAEQQRDVHPLRLAAILLLAIAAAWVLRRIVTASKVRRANRRRQVLASEEYAFGQLQRALASGDTRASYKHLLEWLERLDGRQSLETFIAEFGDASLRSGIAELRAALYSKVERPPDLPALSRSMAKAYKTYKQSRRHNAATSLPRLNP